MSYRDNIDALVARHAALESEVAQKTRERDATAQILDEARTKAKLPVLDNIRVASPCSAEWSKMAGDERTRFCGDCKKHVYNLSEMTREEAQWLLVEKEGRLCVRYYQRHDGTILLKDCAVGVKRKRKRMVIVAGAAAALAGGLAYAIATQREERHVEAMPIQGGAVAMPVVDPEPVIEHPAPQTEPSPGKKADEGFVVGEF